MCERSLDSFLNLVPYVPLLRCAINDQRDMAFTICTRLRPVCFVCCGSEVVGVMYSYITLCATKNNGFLLCESLVLFAAPMASVILVMIF